ncbi:MAG: PD-(D/E)XK nuclease family protein [Bacteroidales bacterium]|nr:PD-(D/E)XK nuclease family protein [Bacteroidales bacterium]
MNLFKVLASGRKSFQEETASAVLLWLLNPTMDHGLGYSFLSKFIQQIGESIAHEELINKVSELTAYFRGERENDTKIWFNLEYHVDNAFIDIVLFMEDWIVAIENKIYQESFSTGQLEKEYNGLKRKLKKLVKEGKIENDKVIMIYLIPSMKTSKVNIPPQMEVEFNELKVKNEDEKLVVTWQGKNGSKKPSIASIITEILKDERHGLIDPIPTYTRDTLKALKVFISNDFQGYTYEGSSRSGGLNPLTEEVLTFNKIKKRTGIGYVGVKGGNRGLLKMDAEDIKEHDFQFTTANMSEEHFWVEKDLFIKVADWLLNDIKHEIEWPEKQLKSKVIYKIAKDYPQIRVGIRGGEKALERMTPEKIREKEWKISSTGKGTNEWFSGKKFKDIVEKKQVL